MANILLIDNDPGTVHVVAGLSRDAGHKVFPFDCVDQALESKQLAEADATLLDLSMIPELSSSANLESIRRLCAASPVILSWREYPQDVIADIMGLGAYGFLPKPYHISQLLQTLNNLLEHQQCRRGYHELKAQLSRRYGIKRIVGSHAAILEVVRLVERVCESRHNLVIQGESGTGKSLVVKVIHQNSAWTDGELHHINCRDLDEPEVRGNLQALVSEPHSSGRQHTVHLENSSDLSSRNQSWLAELLEAQESQTCRLIASAKVDLQQLTAQNQFNSALYYALGEVTIQLPALRERFGDLSLLIRHFLKTRRTTSPDSTNTTLSVDPQVLRVLETHDWPDNLRELRHVIEQSATVCNGDVIKVTDLPRTFLEGKEDTQQFLPMEFAIGKSLHEFVREVEQRYIEETLRRFKDNRHEAAQALGISQATLYRKLDLGRTSRSAKRYGNGDSKAAKGRRRSA